MSDRVERFKKSQEARTQDIKEAWSLKDTGYSIAEIAERMSLNESSVRHLLNQNEEYTVTFKVNLSTAEGREHAERLCSWLAKERYDCPDTEVAAKFHYIMTDIEDR
jgi:DNA-directed RNA polymerase sigma subunit (sigma70/sigma32)